jgi:hypothetical protein
MLMIWSVTNVHFEAGVDFCSQRGAAHHFLICFRAQLVAFQICLCPTGFSTVIEMSSFMAVPGSYPAVVPRAVAIF